MKKLYTGKTKDVYELKTGNVLLKFKDDVTGKDGKFDPGENAVGLTIEGVGAANLAVTTMFFQLLEKEGIKTHFIKTNYKDNTMEVLKGIAFGKGLEIICRLKATGSFLKRYGEYITDGEIFEKPYVEVTLKDDLRNDPLITQEGLEALGIMSAVQFQIMKERTIRITQIISKFLENKGLELWDIKYEFGYHNGEIILIDEISSGNMRVYKSGVRVEPLDLSKTLLSK